MLKENVCIIIYSIKNVFLSILSFLNFAFFIVVLLQFSCLFTHYSPLPCPPPTPTVNPPHCMCPWVLYSCSSACLFPFTYPPLPPPQGVARIPPLSGTVLASDHCLSLGIAPAMCVCNLFLPRTFAHSSCTHHRYVVSREGKEPLGYYPWPSSPPICPHGGRGFWCHARGCSPFVDKTFLQPILKHPLHTSASKLNIN